MSELLDSEMEHLTRSLQRDPTDVELALVSAEWSEHCSYKSSKKYIRTLPQNAPHVITGPGLDSGVIDAGDGYILTAHIESHNHPSAVEPYGGAATGVGGIIRDIVSAGTRPIAILDGLHFGQIDSDRHAAWLLRDAVRGIADYGNCLGIPTVSGETIFDASYAGYALVDVAAIGFGKRERLIYNTASPGDRLLLIGGPTGYDGVGGAQFASGALESEARSAVQIPDPFTEKMVLETILECRSHLKAVKDLGGGGLACAVSETADALGVGMQIDTDRVHTRKAGMTPSEILVSESQERMLVVVDDSGAEVVRKSCQKFRVPCSEIGTVNDNGMVKVYSGDKLHASIPTQVAAHAPQLRWPTIQPKSREDYTSTPPMSDYTDVLYRMLTGPYCASRRWIYSQYDHEVGIRTVQKPGRDSPLLRLDNGKYLAVSMDSNPRHCQLNPYRGAMGCFEEACRNIRCVGAEPVAMLDHLQFGSPEDPHIMWAFAQSVAALRHYAARTRIPCIGGKVSLYNETDNGPIKHSPVVMVLGLTDTLPRIRPPTNGDILYVLGDVKSEMGGSLYHGIRNHTGGICPGVDIKSSIRNGQAASCLVREGAAHMVHDVSLGGMAVGVSWMCIDGNVGCDIDPSMVPGHLAVQSTLFSETHCRYAVVVSPDTESDARRIMERQGATYSKVGVFGGDTISFADRTDTVCRLEIDMVRKRWHESLEEMTQRG